MNGERYHFLYERHTPRQTLRGVVDDYWVIQAARCRTEIELALPDSVAEIYFNLGERGRQIWSGHAAPRLQPRVAWVVGPRANALLIAKELADCHIMGVRLHAGSIAHVLGVPARELTGGMIDLADFWGRVAHDTVDRMHEATDPQDRLRIIEDALTQRLARSRALSDVPHVRELCTAVTRSRSAAVADVARTLGLSHRRLISIFDEHVGLKPKAFQRVHRLRQVLESIGGATHYSWTRVAIGCGYYDQAHFIHDFRKLTGLTPGEYRAQRTSVSHGFVPYRRVAND